MITHIRVAAVGIGSLATTTYMALQVVAGIPVTSAIGEGLVIGLVSFLGSYYMLKQKVDDLKEDLTRHKTDVGGKLDTLVKDIKDISKSVNELVGESRIRAIGSLRTHSSDKE